MAKSPLLVVVGQTVPVVMEGVGVLAAVLERLAEREVEVKAVLGTQIRARQLRAHLQRLRALER